MLEMATVPVTATCTAGPSAVTGERCGAPAVRGFVGADGRTHRYECAGCAPQTPAGEWERDERGMPIGYYVTVRDGARSGFLLGPYRTHGEALGQVDRGRELAERGDPFAHFYAFGTARAPERRTVFGA